MSVKDNARVLQCALCEAEWQFRRLRCVNCGNEEKETLGYYVFDEDTRYRFDYCDICKTYIKTIVIPKGMPEQEIDITVENIISSFIDASAIDMGYQRP